MTPTNLSGFPYHRGRDTLLAALIAGPGTVAAHRTSGVSDGSATTSGASVTRYKTYKQERYDAV